MKYSICSFFHFRSTTLVSYSKKKQKREVMIFSKQMRTEPRVCYGIFHIEGFDCTARHELVKQLTTDIDTTWTNLDIETFYFHDLLEAERTAKELCFHFDHISEDRKPGNTGFMRGEIGLWLGTIYAIQKFLESEYDILVLFDDDVSTTPKAIRETNSFLSHLPGSFEIFAMYTPEREYARYGRKRHFGSFIRKYTIDNPNKPTRLYQGWSTAAYAISRSGAEKIIRATSSKIDAPVDWFLFRGNFKSYSFKPNGPKPFEVKDLESTIQIDRLGR